MPPPPPSAANAVSLSVNSFGVVRDPISGKEDVVWEYVWTNVDRKTTVKVSTYYYADIFLVRKSFHIHTFSIQLASNRQQLVHNIH